MAKRDPNERDQLEPADGVPYCAFVRSDGSPCLNRKTPGSDYCRTHIRKPRFVSIEQPGLVPVDFDGDMDAAIAEMLPQRLREGYLRAIGDAKLVSYRSDLSLINLRRMELVARFFQETGETTGHWDRCRELVSELEQLTKDAAEARRDGDIEGAEALQGEFREKLPRLFRAIKDGDSRESAWEELEKQIHRMAQLREKELKRMEVLHQMLTVEQYLMLTEHVMESVRKFVKDQAVVALIGESIEKTFDHQAGGGVA